MCGVATREREGEILLEILVGLVRTTQILLACFSWDGGWVGGTGREGKREGKWHEMKTF